MRASRLLSLLLLLQGRGRMTAQQLAIELEVSVRTIYRDVEALHAAGVPLYGDAGHDGGYQLVDGYRTRLTGLTADEAESLFLAGLPGPAAELGLGAVVAATHLKLMAALPPELRDRAGTIRERFHLDAPSWYRGTDDTPYLAAVADGVWHQRRVRVRYRRWKAPEEVTRTLDPLGVVLKAGRWYVVARCEGQIRTYRVSAILRLHPLGEPFERPDGFVLADYWRTYLSAFDARRYRGEAALRLSPEARQRLPDCFEPALVRAIEDSAGPPDRHGWIRAVIPIEGVEHALADLLRLGGELEVLEPPALRERFVATARALSAIYLGPGCGRARRHRRT